MNLPCISESDRALAFQFPMEIFLASGKETDWGLKEILYFFKVKFDLNWFNLHILNLVCYLTFMKLINFLSQKPPPVHFTDQLSKHSIIHSFA